MHPISTTTTLGAQRPKAVKTHFRSAYHAADTAASSSYTSWPTEGGYRTLYGPNQCPITIPVFHSPAMASQFLKSLEDRSQGSCTRQSSNPATKLLVRHIFLKTGVHCCSYSPLKCPGCHASQFPPRAPTHHPHQFPLGINCRRGGRNHGLETHLDLVQDDKGTLHSLDSLVLCGGPALSVRRRTFPRTLPTGRPASKLHPRGAAARLRTAVASQCSGRKCLDVLGTRGERRNTPRDPGGVTHRGGDDPSHGPFLYLLQDGVVPRRNNGRSPRRGLRL